MTKRLLGLALCSTISWAESFEAFVQQAVTQSPYLHASALKMDQARLEGNKLTRYDNPTIEVEASKFSEQNGYRFGFNQPVRVWGVGEDKERIARSLSTNAKANIAVERSRFIKELSLLYVDYAQAQNNLNLAKEELKIAQSINNVSKEGSRAETDRIVR